MIDQCCHRKIGSDFTFQFLFEGEAFIISNATRIIFFAGKINEIPIVNALIGIGSSLSKYWLLR
jgi:hypothetical protein